MSAIHKVIVWYPASLAAWVADCMCGWGGKKRATEGAAKRDGEGHHVEVSS